MEFYCRCGPSERQVLRLLVVGPVDYSLEESHLLLPSLRLRCDLSSSLLAFLVVYLHTYIYLLLGILELLHDTCPAEGGTSSRYICL